MSKKYLIILVTIFVIGIGTSIVLGFLWQQQGESWQVGNWLGKDCNEAGKQTGISSANGFSFGDCCEGLVTIGPSDLRAYDENCQLIGEGYTAICSDCGNGICESWEHRCNCPEDCDADEISQAGKWIGGGTKTSSILVKINKTVLLPSEDFLVSVKSWTFNPGNKMEDHSCYIGVYNAKKPNESLYSKNCLISQKEDDNYVRIEPFEFELTAPQKGGVYTYWVAEKLEGWPGFENYDKKVEFTIEVLGE